MAPRDPIDRSDDAPEDREVTARPTGREAGALVDEDADKVVPMSNVGGASPTPLGHDSGGDLPGADDDLSNLSEPEPPESPELGAVHVERPRRT
jgi:hypothetical protein